MSVIRMWTGPSVADPLHTYVVGYGNCLQLGPGESWRIKCNLLIREPASMAGSTNPTVSWQIRMFPPPLDWNYWQPTGTEGWYDMGTITETASPWLSSPVLVGDGADVQYKAQCSALYTAPAWQTKQYVLIYMICNDEASAHTSYPLSHRMYNTAAVTLTSVPGVIAPPQWWVDEP